MYATREDTIVSCSAAQWICAADPLCSTALEYYNRFCQAMFRGKKCTDRCMNSINILGRQPKASKLESCYWWVQNCKLKDVSKMWTNSYFAAMVLKISTVWKSKATWKNYASAKTSWTTKSMWMVQRNQHLGWQRLKSFSSCSQSWSPWSLIGLGPHFKSW